MNGTCVEKIVVFRCGLAFGSELGVGTSFALVRKGLYRLKSAGATWHRMFAVVMLDLGFAYCKADHIVWMRLSTRARGEPYNECLRVYTDDFLALSEDP